MEAFFKPLELQFSIKKRILLFGPAPFEFQENGQGPSENGGNVFHGMAHRQQIINFANICIINNLGNPALGHFGYLCNFFLGPSQAAEAEDGGCPVCPLPGTDFANPV